MVVLSVSTAPSVDPRIDPPGRRLTLELEGHLTPEYLNCLRTTMKLWVPTMAIDLVAVYDDTTCCIPEFTVHRLGLVPLRSQALLSGRICPAWSLSDPCPECGFSGGPEVLSNKKVPETKLAGIRNWNCERCCVKLRINCRNHGSSNRDLLSSALTVSDQESKRPDAVVPALQDTLLIRMKELNSYRVTAHAIAGRGGYHAKWSPIVGPTTFHRKDFSHDGSTDVPWIMRVTTNGSLTALETLRCGADKIVRWMDDTIAGSSIDVQVLYS